MAVHLHTPKNKTGDYPGELSSTSGQHLTSASLMMFFPAAKGLHVGTQSLLGGLLSLGLLLSLGEKKQNRGIKLKGKHQHCPPAESKC